MVIKHLKSAVCWKLFNSRVFNVGGKSYQEIIICLCSHLCASLCVFSSLVLSKEVARRFVVQSELARAVAGHADSHETQEDGHARHRRVLPALQHRLGCLSLKERAGVTTHEAATTPTATRNHRQGLRQCICGLPSGSGRRRVLKEVTLVTHLSQPGDGLAIRKELYHYLHSVMFQVPLTPTVTASALWWFGGHLRIMSQSKTYPEVRYKFSYCIC